MHTIRLVVLALAASGTLFAQHQLQSLSAQPPSPGGALDFHVVMEGDHAAAFHRVQGVERQVYMYRRTPVRLELEQIIGAPVGSLGFAAHIALDGTTLVVGAPDTAGRGRVYVYERTAGQWTLEATLHTQLNEPGGYFGTAVAIDGDTIVAGAVGENLTANVDGFAYFFERSPAGQWDQVARVRPQDAEPDSAFGSAISLDGDAVVISSPTGPGGQAGQRGAAWMYRRTNGTWAIEQRLVPSVGPGYSAHYGTSVSLDGDRVAVSAWRQSFNGVTGAGTVHVFEGGPAGWTETSIVFDPDAQPGDQFGSTVDLEGDTLVVGATNRGDVRQGAGLIFRESSGVWTLGQVLRPSFGSAASLPNSSFGFAVSLDRDAVLLGANLDDTYGVNAGSLRLFDLDRGTTRYCVATTNSLGGAALLFAEGSRDVEVNRFELRALGVPDGFGAGAYGDMQAQLPVGNGFVCVGGALQRLPIAVASGGELRLAIDFTAPPTAGGMILAGSTWNFQAWYRDVAAGGAGWNLSDAVSVTFD